MGLPAAKEGDQVLAQDTHRVVLPNAAIVPRLFPFVGKIDTDLSPNVRIGGERAATVKSIATNQQRHSLPPNQHFATEPSNKGQITEGSDSVRINHKAAARHGDPVKTCNDLVSTPLGKVIASGRVRIG